MSPALPALVIPVAFPRRLTLVSKDGASAEYIPVAIARKGAASSTAIGVFPIRAWWFPTPVRGSTQCSWGGRLIPKYTDSDTLDENIDDFVITPQGSADADNLLEPGEIIEFTVDVSSYGLKKEDEFLIEVRPPDGAVIGLGRSIPATISAIINLD